MPNETAEASATINREISGMFDQAFRAYGDSLKVAMKAQEDAVKFWGEAVGKTNPMQSVATEWIPIVQKNADEYLRMLEASYRRNADLLKKLIQAPNSENGMGQEKRTRELWENSMEVARDNAQDLASTNLRVAQSWTDVLKKGAQQQQKVAVGK